MLVEGAIANHDVGLEVERQTQRVEIARTDRRPLVVNQRDFAVQRPLAILVNAHTGLQ